MKSYEEVSVLEPGNDGAVVSISGQENPLVLLKPAYLEHLVLLSDKAERELLGVPERFETSALKQLCMEVQTLLTSYRETCNKFYGDTPAEASLKAVQEEVEAMRLRLGMSGSAPEAD
ncbi:hypothetical protein [Hydrogenophaga sp. H7]|uniref:hypothetical protein n=1 Tax=Hydrogenophaga sp. H7 TaxID=1882399 RepID=UPI0009A31530|nr:hypothetical protein [Hydrogenophaga sp. H7]OPF63183.1 hypothetical protein BC358_09035 [Hydrogenophaga sp. H7]